MFSIDKSDVRRIATAALGALLLSTVSVVAAVGPTRAATATGVQSNAVGGSSK